MQELDPKGAAPCACDSTRPAPRGETPGAAKSDSPTPGRGLAGALALLALGLVLWFAVYFSLQDAARYLTGQVLGLDLASHLGKSVEFFLYDTPKVLMLLAIVVFGVGILRSFFTPERTRRILAGKSEAVGNVMAALLGIVTPFCSCSAVPLFIGFLGAGVPLGVTFSFLVSAPMVNEIAVVLLYGLLGWKVAALYMVTGLAIAIVSGMVIGKLKMERHVEEWVTKIRLDTSGEKDAELSWPERIQAGRVALRDIMGKVWPWVVGGIAVGAGIHGYVPEGMLASIMGKEAWWSVPAATLLGIPMYSNAAGIIPVVEALLGKGAALGTVLAFMMSVIALSLPEMVILRKVLKPRLILVFAGVVGTGIMLVGFLFNAVV